MKILFLCGSLEPGRDGVGDYTRRLATELIKQGHQISAIALYDQFAQGVVITIQKIEDIEIDVLRIPYNDSSKHRFEIANKTITSFNPEWISLQFVPFSFQAKGLPLGLGSLLAKFGKGRRWHIMFHELWVGMDVKASIKLKLWGRVQKLLIESLVSKLQPKVVHTQTRLYQISLNKVGVRAMYLPLFSNIPSMKEVALENRNNINSSCCIVVFGTIHSGAPIEKFANEVSLYSRQKKVGIILTMIGRNGKEEQKWFHVCKLEGLPVQILGEQPPEVISEVLSNSTMGIATTAFAVVEKSGTVAAMREHNLPILCLSKSWTPHGIENFEPPIGIFEYEPGNIDKIFSERIEVNNRNTVKEVCRQFLEALFNSQP